jgi:hypothetical protein
VSGGAGPTDPELRVRIKLNTLLANLVTDDLTGQPEAFNPVLKEVDFTGPALAA